MEISRRSYIVGIASVLGFLVVVISVYVAYTSPTGFNARRNSDLHSLTEKEESVYTNLDGENIHFLDTEGDVILIVNMWATWSPYTQSEFAVCLYLILIPSEEDIQKYGIVEAYKRADKLKFGIAQCIEKRLSDHVRDISDKIIY